MAVAEILGSSGATSNGTWGNQKTWETKKEKYTRYAVNSVLKAQLVADAASPTVARA